MYEDPKNMEGVDYYLLRCIEEKIKLTEPCIDDDNQSYPTGSVVIEGIDYPLTRFLQLIREYIKRLIINYYLFSILLKILNEVQI